MTSTSAYKIRVAFSLLSLLLATAFVPWIVTTPHAAMGEEIYLDNGVVRIGVRLDLGGSITYMSTSNSGHNIINNYDWGRQIQQSYYSGPTDYLPDGAQQSPYWNPWPWNPIQTGDCFENRATVLESSNDGSEIYVKSVPMQWALNNVPGEATFETWVRLEGQVAHVRSRLVNARTDTTQQFPARHQELPAVYTVGTLHRLFTYKGTRPFTSAAVTELPYAPPPAWQAWRATENWAANLNDDGWGLGVYHPGSARFKGGFHGTPNTGMYWEDSTGYISPLHQEVLDHNITYEYEYDLILGTLAEIRQWVYDHKPDTRPDYRFKSDRQHWYSNKGDAGWPIASNYRVKLDGIDPMMFGPACAWRAEDVPKLYISAAFNLVNPAASSKTAQLFWEVDNQGGFSEQQSIRFDIIPDGQFHTYEIDLTSSQFYQGLISQLRFDPIAQGQTGDYVDISFISHCENKIAGDANRDGRVDDTDAAILATNWQTLTAATWAMGDFNGDERVDDADATLLAANWQSGVSATASAPEPSTLAGLLALCLAGLSTLARR